MSVAHLHNQFRLIAQLEAQSIAKCCVGIVSSYDPTYYAAKVLLQPPSESCPDGIPTDWLPILSPMVGQGWGIVCPPNIGDHVLVNFLEGDLNAAFIDSCFYNDQNRPPVVQGTDSQGNQTQTTALSGEFWLVHKSGSFIKLTNDNSVAINSAQDLNITVHGTVNLTAPTINVGSAGETLRKLVTDAIESTVNNHVHSGVVPGSGNSGPPTATIVGSAQLTSALNAG